MWGIVTSLFGNVVGKFGGANLIMYAIIAVVLTGVVWRYFYLEGKVDEQKTTISKMEDRIATLDEQMKLRKQEAEAIQGLYNDFYKNQSVMNAKLQNKILNLSYGVEALKNPTETQTKLNNDFNRVFECIEKISQGVYDEALCK